MLANWECRFLRLGLFPPAAVCFSLLLWELERQRLSLYYAAVSVGGHIAHAPPWCPHYVHDIIVINLGAVIAQLVRQSDENTSPYINTKISSASLSITAKNFRKYATGYLCITENNSAVLNDSLFLLVMICRRLWPTRWKHPPLYNRSFWTFGHDFLKSLQFVHDGSLYRINSTVCFCSLCDYIMWRSNRTSPINTSTKNQKSGMSFRKIILSESVILLFA